MTIPIAERQWLALDGKVAIVTGGAGGIGQGIAELFAQFGATVIVADRDTAGATAVATAIAADGGNATAIAYDQADPASITAMVSAVVARFGRLDVMVNGAAAFGFAALEEITAASWDQIHAVNLRGTALCCQAAVSAMATNQGGAIINISSVAGNRVVLFDNLAYGTSKAGINALTQGIARQYAEQGIRANAVIPGAIDIPNPDPALAGFAMRGPLTQAGGIPLTGAPGLPQDIASACVFLASDAARYITGQLLAVDGGVSIG